MTFKNSNNKIMTKLRLIPLVAFLAICTFSFSCKSDGVSKVDPAMDAASVVKELQKKLITAKDGDEIILPAGTFDFKRGISLNDTPNIKIKGAGKGKTVLNFKGQIEGAEGLLIKNVNGLTLEGFTVSDSKGDAIKVQDSRDVIFRDLETTWTTGKKSTNGAYGLYPVSCTNVLMEECEASFAMDAGIYVGQSNNVVVRNNYVHNNVAGLEIENTINGEVYGNIAKNNTGGMMIFDMPDLPQANGDKIKFYDNLMENNNGENFAPAGMVVSTIPPGAGMFIMSHSNIEVRNNTYRGHKTFGVSVNSWLITGVPFKSEEFDPFSTNIDIHDNVFEGTAGEVDQTTDNGKLLHAALGGIPVDIVIDGIFKPGEPQSYCFKNNGDVTFANLNAGMGAEPEMIIKNISRDMSPFDCERVEFDTSDHDKWLAIK